MPKNLNISDLCDFYGGILTEKQYSLLRYYYDDDLSLAEIADIEEITPQGVRDIIKRAEQKLIETESKLGFYKQHQQLKDKLKSSLGEEAALKRAAQEVIEEL
jgi:predicted DNA-binding protein YlxM (UPF0122 family)